MHIKYFVGKNAIRTKPTAVSGDYNRNFMTHPIHVLKVTDFHILWKNIENNKSSVINIATFEFIDDNWTDYDELMDMTKTLSDVAEEMIAESESNKK